MRPRLYDPRRRLPAIPRTVSGRLGLVDIVAISLLRVASWDLRFNSEPIRGACRHACPCVRHMPKRIPPGPPSARLSAGRRTPTVSSTAAGKCCRTRQGYRRMRRPLRLMVLTILLAIMAFGAAIPGGPAAPESARAATTLELCGKVNAYVAP